MMSSVSASSFREGRIWKRVHGIWKPLYGGFARDGVSIEWHDFQLLKPMAWSESFHQGSLEICLNYTGFAEFQSSAGRQTLQSGQIALHVSRNQSPNAKRLPDSMHRFITLELSANYLRKQFASVLDGLLPNVQHFLNHPDRFEPWVEIHALPATLLVTRMHLLEPPVNSTALDAWYQSKILDILAQTLFRPDKPGELFCQRHRRQNKERVEQAKFFIERDLENPPSLEMLAKEVHCSPFYLSRLFAEETGISIPKYLRLKRVEKAADLMLTKGMNVTEAAMAVGYSSLGAFQKAFAHQFGVTPGRFISGKK